MLWKTEPWASLPGSSFSLPGCSVFQAWPWNQIFLLQVQFWPLHLNLWPETDAPVGLLCPGCIMPLQPSSAHLAYLLWVPSVWLRLFLLPFDWPGDHGPLSYSFFFGGVLLLCFRILHWFSESLPIWTSNRLPLMEHQAFGRVSSKSVLPITEPPPYFLLFCMISLIPVLQSQEFLKQKIMMQKGPAQVKTSAPRVICHRRSDLASMLLGFFHLTQVLNELFNPFSCFTLYF